MGNGPGPGNSAVLPKVSPRSAPPLRLLVELEPWYRVFFWNVIDLMRPRPYPSSLYSAPAPFWPDVFVSTRLPWGGFWESAVYHFVALALLLGLPQFWPHRPPLSQPKPFDRTAVIYYDASEYLPPLNSAPRPALPRKGEPVYARQPIISVPPRPDNRSQTILTPPDVKLNHEIPLPNIVAWRKTDLPVPIAATTRSTAQLNLPSLPPAVVAPTPEVHRSSDRRLRGVSPSVIPPPPEIAAATARTFHAPQPAIIEPPPNVESSSMRNVGDLNMGASAVILPAPQLPVAEQRALASQVRRALGVGGGQVVPPPPSVQGTNGASNVGGRLIALGIHPVALAGPIEMPAGNRGGTFAATPEGKPDAPGTPNIPAQAGAASDLGGAASTNGHGNGAGTAGASSDVPPGIYVGPAPQQAPAATIADSGSAAVRTQALVNPSLLAGVVPPRMSNTSRPATAVEETQASEVEKKVFGIRRFYSMTLNMPNLNSLGGSWVIRFAELKEDGVKGELVPPVATQKVDPAYPAELMRQNVQGTVTLYAVILSDGTVGDVRTLRGVDDRLDQFAREALLHWRFRPATKNGTAVALEAVVLIPFRARSGF